MGSSATHYSLPTTHSLLQASPAPLPESILPGPQPRYTTKLMSLGQVNGGYNLLGQGGAATAARMAPIPEAMPAPEPMFVEPKLGIAWGDFHQGAASSLRALFSGPFGVRKFLAGDYFRDCWVERRIPKRAVFAAALWHVVFLVAPFSLLTAVVRHNSAFDNAQLTWSGPIQDFPALEIRAAKPKPVLRSNTAKPLSPKGADAFHPRQRILTDPIHPTHPRQTLLNPVAPQLAPKILPDMPDQRGRARKASSSPASSRHLAQRAAARCSTPRTKTCGPDDRRFAKRPRAPEARIKRRCRTACGATRASGRFASRARTGCRPIC